MKEATTLLFSKEQRGNGTTPPNDLRRFLETNAAKSLPARPLAVPALVKDSRISTSAENIRLITDPCGDHRGGRENSTKVGSSAQPWSKLPWCSVHEGAQHITVNAYDRELDTTTIGRKWDCGRIIDNCGISTEVEIC